ncbi:MAG: hypothetical protein A2Z17_01455 [Gammaproteobacteria bacterium RBG_16_66_13]|jgi:hypothetical protein|nr:MAG: hypothetical protein A2Z17_01455 [Gammaproteobacteria bacterium RBG_16_66_13]
MPHAIHQPAVALVQTAIRLMDTFLRDKIDLETYAQRLQELDVESLMVRHQEDFKQDAELVHYLDALMILSSLKHELDFQVAEYGANVASEDISMLKELLERFARFGPVDNLAVRD